MECTPFDQPGLVFDDRRLDDAIMDIVSVMVPRLVAGVGSVSLRALRLSLQSCIGLDLTRKKDTIKRFAQRAAETLVGRGDQANDRCGRQLYTQLSDDVCVSGRWRGVGARWRASCVGILAHGEYGCDGLWQVSLP